MAKQKNQDGLNWNKPSMLKKRMECLIELGCRLIMSAKALGQYDNMPLDQDARNMLCTLKTENTTNDHQSKHQEHFDQWTNQERIDLFTRNRKVLNMANENDQQNIAFDFDIHKSESLQDLGFTCFILSSQYALLYDKIKVKKDGMADKDDNEAITVLFMVDDEISRRSREAIGYWTAKLEHKKRSKNQETKQQQEAIKEEYVTNAYLNLIKDEKKIFANLSQNKIAKRIYDYVFPLLKDKKTATGKFVLTRTKKIDKEGKTILSGLSTDTIIAIMRRQDKFTFNPFKNNASK